MFERSNDAILILEGDRFVDCNPAAVRMLRCASREEVLQTHPSELSPPTQPDGRSSYEKANELIATAVREGGHRFEWMHRRADGEVFPVEVLLTPLEEDGQLQTVWREIGERKRLEEELRHAHKLEALGKLAGGIAHDFNNLLVVILGHAEELAGELQGQAALVARVRDIERAGREAARVTSQLLAFGRRQNLRFERVDLTGLVADVGGMLRRMAGPGIDFVLEPCGEPLVARVDPSQIIQVLLNLVSNARDAVEPGGRITVRCQREGSWAVIEVRDDGVGMAPEVLERVREPFFTTKPVGQGTGLGLSSAHGIVAQSGGELQLLSEPGRGTVVRVLLPVSEAPPTAPPPPAPSLLMKGRSRRVLLVDDQPEILGHARAALRRHGVEVITAPDGATALELAGDNCDGLSLLITDLRMPGMSGDELAAALRERCPDLPVLYMTGFAGDLEELVGERAGLLRKPFSGSDLVDAVMSFLLDQAGLVE